MLFTATEEPNAEPPRVRLDLATEDTMTTFSAITIRRDGVVIRAVAPVGSDVSVVYDYDAVYDVPSVYTVEAQTVTVTAGFTETWASVAAWTGSDWSVSAGSGTSSVDGATITRTASGTIGSLQSLDVDWTTVQIRDASDVVLVSIEVVGNYASVVGSGVDVEPRKAAGSGAFSLVLSQGIAYFSGVGYESVSVPYDGIPVEVGLVASPGDPLEVSSFATAYVFDAAVTAGGDVWVVDYYNHRILRYDSAGVSQQVVGSYGSTNGLFIRPTGIAIDSSGNLFVVDYGNSRVQKFNSSGVYQSQFGSFGTGNGQFHAPVGICIDSSSNIWITDQYNHRVQKFNSSGVYQSQFGSSGAGNGQFAYPWGITRDSSNNLYVTDQHNSRVQKFNSSGVYQTQWGSEGTAEGQFVVPLGIEADSSDDIYVADYLNGRVQKFTDAGVFLYEWDGTRSGQGYAKFAMPYSVTVDSADDVYVVDTNNAAVRKYGPSQQVAVVDDVTVTLAPPAPVTVVGEATETLNGLAMWLVHSTTPDLSVKVDAGAVGWQAPVVVNEETSRQVIAPASGRRVLEIEGSDTPVVVTTGPRRIPDRVLEVEVVDFATRDLVLAALKSNDPVLLRSPASWGVDMPEGWFSVDDIAVERVRNPKIGQETILTLPLTPVRTPIIETDFGISWADVVVSGATWDDIAASGKTWLDLITTGP